MATVRSEPVPGTFGAMFRRAVEEKDPKLAGEIVDRARQMGANYEDVYTAAERVTGVDRATWDGLLEEADALESEGEG